MTHEPRADALTPKQAARVAEIRRAVVECEQSHADDEYPFCEQYGCMSMRELLDLLDAATERQAAETAALRRRVNELETVQAAAEQLDDALHAYSEGQYTGFPQPLFVAWDAVEQALAATQPAPDPEPQP